jgi:hypothetical protein
MSCKSLEHAEDNYVTFVFTMKGISMSEQATPKNNPAHLRRTRDHAAMLEARRRVRPLLRPRGAAPSAPPLQLVAPPGIARNGSPADVLLQGFHWDSHGSQNPNWYQILAQNAGAIQNAKFDIVWFPPPSESADAEGYMPTRWNVFDSSYGSAASPGAGGRGCEPSVRRRNRQG